MCLTLPLKISRLVRVEEHFTKYRLGVGYQGERILTMYVLIRLGGREELVYLMERKDFSTQEPVTDLGVSKSLESESGHKIIENISKFHY